MKGGNEQLRLRVEMRNRLDNETLAFCVVFKRSPLGDFYFIVYVKDSANRNNSRMEAMGLAGPGEQHPMAEYLEKRGPVDGPRDDRALT